LVESILLGFGLAADAVSVSVACAVRAERVTFRQGASMALTFGAFQGLMPLIGWTAGSAFAAHVSTFGPWIAAVVFLPLGGKMIRDGWSGEVEARDWPGPRELLALGVATSIDALVIGATLAITGTPIWLAAPTIATITASTCVIGLLVGQQLGERAGPRASLIGGALLVLLAFRALFWA
jgi:putative Mn2+ efflux pump MntP